MATNSFRGDAQPVAQVNTVTVGGVAAAGQIYSVTINRKVVYYTATGADTNDTIATALQAALAACTFAEFTEVTWTVSTNVVTGTSAEAGRLFVNTSSADGTGTLVTATTTASRGPYHWDTASNWSLNAVPVNGDDVVIEGSASHIRYGLGQTAVTLASFLQKNTYTGEIGLRNQNPSGYAEYRPTYLAIKVSGQATFGQGDGSGSGLVRMDLSSTTCTVQVEATGSPVENGKPALYLIGTGAANTLNHLSGRVGIAFDAGEVATFPTIRTGYINSQATDAVLHLGAGCTLTTLNQAGGDITTRASFTTVNLESGTLTLLDAVAITTLNGEGGTVYWQSTGTIGAANLGTGCTLDARRDIRGRILTNCAMNANSGLLDSFKTITFSNPVNIECSLDEVRLDLGSNFAILRS